MKLLNYFYLPPKKRVWPVGRYFIAAWLLLLGAIVTVHKLGDIPHRIQAKYWYMRSRFLVQPPETVVMDQAALPGRAGFPPPAAWNNLVLSDYSFSLFVHEFHPSDGGQSFLMGVGTVDPDEIPAYGQFLDLVFCVVTPSHHVDHRSIKTPIFRSPSFKTGSNPLKLFAGQPDPSDLSHCTIRFSSPARSGVIHIWVRSETDFKVEVRDSNEALSEKGN